MEAYATSITFPFFNVTMVFLTTAWELLEAMLSSDCAELVVSSE